MPCLHCSGGAGLWWTWIGRGGKDVRALPWESANGIRPYSSVDASKDFLFSFAEFGSITFKFREGGVGIVEARTVELGN
jgi:hypothetical protein